MKKLITLALTLAISCLMLSACGSQQPASSNSAASGQPSSSAAASQSAVPEATVNIENMKTLADVLAVTTQHPSNSFNESTYVGIFVAGDTYLRVVLDIDAALSNKLNSLSFMSDNYLARLGDAAGNIKIKSIEDITSGKLSDDAMAAYVGKTYQDLINDGFTFSDYYLYGGEDTGASMDKGYFSYGVMFDAETSEDHVDDGGASIKDAKITFFEFQGMSTAAVDLELSK